ncbi:WAT1-related protein At1g43650-like [Magnolia sinica]|uniref:WAT1-related protein At1g43650-like n=1 Tax=Magnolia sinica TaxID=86752 RepID=UPI002659CDAB|nr:WAT1-related protein At1g43650-like [Magnolia sinica]
MGMKALFGKYKAPMSMLLVQLLATGMFLLSKAVLNEGAFVFSLLTYRLIIATIFLAPFAYFIERNMARKLSWVAVVWIFFNGLSGTTMAMGLYYYGLRNTSASFATNFLNLIPVITFILSTIVRIEKLGLESKGGRVKIAGTILCVAGALTISLYKGMPLHMWTSHVHNPQISTKRRTTGEMARGSCMLVGCCLSTAVWFIIQVRLFKVYPSMYWATMLSCLAGCIQSTIVGIAIDRRKATWRLGWDLQLLTIVYSAVFSTGANFCLISWAVAKRGPTYPSMFNPLSLIFVTILESFFMGEEIFIGSILGMIMIIGGLYAFLWGKRNEPAPSIVRPCHRKQLSQPNVQALGT